MPPLSLLAAYLLLFIRLTVASYCSNGPPVIVNGTFGVISDGSPSFNTSRPGSDCSWLIPIPENQTFNLEVQHWELNPNSMDRIGISFLYGDTPLADLRSGRLLSTLQEISVWNITGFWQGQSQTIRTSWDTKIFGSRGTLKMVKVRFMTETQSPQFDGFVASWWYGATEADRKATCPKDCFANAGRGTCINGTTCACKPGYAGADCHNDDVARLMNFYRQCGGPNWIEKTGWSELTEHPCTTSSTWAGISECSANRVVSLALPANNIVCGAAGAPDLPLFLRNIDLSSNILRRFPASIANMSQIIHVSLSNASMSGTVPDALSSSVLPIVRFDISNNNFSGLLFPHSTPWLQGLLEFDVRNNQFEGWLPVGLSGMQVPESAWVDGNNFL
jgi:hypothetical protein